VQEQPGPPQEVARGVRGDADEECVVGGHERRLPEERRRPRAGPQVARDVDATAVVPDRTLQPRVDLDGARVVGVRPVERHDAVVGAAEDAVAGTGTARPSVAEAVEHLREARLVPRTDQQVEVGHRPEAGLAVAGEGDQTALHRQHADADGGRAGQEGTQVVGEAAGAAPALRQLPREPGDRVEGGVGHRPGRHRPGRHRPGRHRPARRVEQVGDEGRQPLRREEVAERPPRPRRPAGHRPQQALRVARPQPGDDLGEQGARGGERKRRPGLGGGGEGELPGAPRTTGGHWASSGRRAIGAHGQPPPTRGTRRGRRPSRRGPHR
jgi:hypothetical protein